jgi:hypothetical protein
MFQFKELSSWRLQGGIDRGNLHRPTSSRNSVRWRAAAAATMRTPRCARCVSRCGARRRLLPVSPPRDQGLTLVHYSAQRKHILWDTLGA